MTFDIFSQDGTILPIAQAVVPIDALERMYGVGVYETLKVRNGILYFAREHVNRLLHSAHCIDLSSPFHAEVIEQYLKEFVDRIGIPSLNIKLLLLGRGTKAPQLLIFPLAPLFPKKKWYRDGVQVYSFQYERWMPQAKTLNMLPSYFYFTHAQQKGGYDALFIDNSGNIREGSRTNIYGMRGHEIVSPPKTDILEGVTMMTLEKLLPRTAYTLTYTHLPFQKIGEYDALFLTSTSTKIIPVAQVDNHHMPPVPPMLTTLMHEYEAALDQSQGMFDRL